VRKPVVTYSFLKQLESFIIILSLLSAIFLNASSVRGEAQPKLLRMLEIKILSNSTVLARLLSTPETHAWQAFKDYFYDLNKSYWHSHAIDRLVEMFELRKYRVLQTGEDEAKNAFIVEVVFQLNDSKRYKERNDSLSILDSFKSNGEYLSSLSIRSERNIYDCTPRDRAWPRIWYSTQKLEWWSTTLSDAPDEYKIYFKIPLHVISNLPSNVTWRIYVNSELVVEEKENTSLIYVDETDIVAVEKIVNGRDGVRYVCNSPSLQAWLGVNRTLSFIYIVEYRVSLDSMLSVAAVNIDDHQYNLPYEFWVAENTSLNVSLIPTVVEGSFTNHVFDGWVDSNGATYGMNFIVRRPMRLTAVWREELNLINIVIIISALIFAFLIPELKKKVSIEIIWEKPSKQA